MICSPQSARLSRFFDTSGLQRGRLAPREERDPAHPVARFIADELRHAHPFANRGDLLAFSIAVALAQSCPIGLLCEFGVGYGHSHVFLAAAARRVVYGFDCGTGLPEDWRDGFPKGSFAVPDGPAVRHEQAILIRGLFAESLPPFLAAHAGLMQFVHIDCDLESSTLDVLRLCKDRIVPGTFILFDEFANFDGWREAGEYPALLKFCRETGKAFSYTAYALDFGWQQVLVRFH